MDSKGGFKPMENRAGYQSQVSYQTSWITAPAGTRCELFHEKWLDCASKLGYTRAVNECANVRRDLTECAQNDIGYKRYLRMQEERFKKGLPFADPPPYDTLHQERMKAYTF